MAKATTGGVSDVNVDPDFIAPPGVPPELALDLGLPDHGRPADERDEDGKGGEESSRGTISSPESNKLEQTTGKQSKNDASPLNVQSTSGRSQSTKKA